MRPATEPRPLPERIVVTAFPDAATQGETGDDPGDFFLVFAASHDIRLPEPDHDWLQLQPPLALSAGLSRIGYRAADNAWAERQARVALDVGGKRYSVEFVQQPGELVQTELVRTLDAPLNLDCLIAVCYVAGLIKKLSPPPLKAIALVIAILAIAALGLIVAIARRAFVQVPEPRPLSTDTHGMPIVVVPGLSSSALPLKALRAEDQTIALQTVRAIYWMLESIE